MSVNLHDRLDLGSGRIEMRVTLQIQEVNGLSCVRILKRNGLKLAVGLGKLLSFITLSLMAVLAVEFWLLRIVLTSLNLCYDK